MTTMEMIENCPDLTDLLGPTIRLPNGSELKTTDFVTPDTKRVFLYFADHGCQYCQMFSPTLSKAYQDYVSSLSDMKNPDQGQETKLIFVSCGENITAFENYLTFPAIHFEAPQHGQLRNKLSVDGLPSLVPLNVVNGVADMLGSYPEGTDFQRIIALHGVNAFPLSPEHVMKLGTLQEQDATKALQELFDDEHCMLSPSDSGRSAGGWELVSGGEGERDITPALVTFKSILEESEYVGIVLGDDHSWEERCKVLKGVAEPRNKSSHDKPQLSIISIPHAGGLNYKSFVPMFDYSLPPERWTGGVAAIFDRIVGGSTTMVTTPALVLVRLDNGDQCNPIDGLCSPSFLGQPVIVSVDEGLNKVHQSGSQGFPWDEAAMKAHEQRQGTHKTEIRSKLSGLEFLKEDELVSRPGAPSLTDLRQLATHENSDDSSDPALIGLYFSASWCPPCQKFNPKLVKCFGDLKAAGKKFEVLFVSFDTDKADFENFYDSMVAASSSSSSSSSSNGNFDGAPRFATLDFDKTVELRRILPDIFYVDNIPSLVLLNPSNCSVVSSEGVDIITETGPEYFPWDKESLVAAKEAQEIEAQQAKEHALKQEQVNGELQRARGQTVLQRLSGNPTDFSHSVEDHTVEATEWCTVGATEFTKHGGILCYELEIIEWNSYSLAQVGFALAEHKGAVYESEETLTAGVGDDAYSWAVDGTRFLKWHNGQDGKWEQLFATPPTSSLAPFTDPDSRGDDLNKGIKSSEREWKKRYGYPSPSRCRSGDDCSVSE